MSLPGETEAGNAGTQPCRGIARGAHRDDERRRRKDTSDAASQTFIGSKDPDALKIPACEGGIFTNGERALSISG